MADRPGGRSHLGDRYGHLFPEVDVGAATKLEALRNYGLQSGAEVYRPHVYTQSML